MTVSTYGLNRRLQERYATIYRQDFNVTSPRFGKYYLDIVGESGSMNHIHDFYCEDNADKIIKWLEDCGYKKVEVCS